MDIREIEQAADMTRANIRFYEKEGLLAPERRPNGYRDYSPADLDTLKKIKLLRQLHLPVDTIRKLQGGTLELDAALAEAERELSAQAEDLGRAQSVCRTMRSERVTYEGLDAQRYLDAISASPASRTGYFSLQEDETPQIQSPWRRFLARTLDFGIYGIILAALFQLVFRVREPPWILRTYLPYVMMLLVEPVLLCTWGSTPGKWILGLEVRDCRGRKLSWGTALARTWGVFGRGYGYGIPIYNIVRLVKCYQSCSSLLGEGLPWEEDLSYTRRENMPVLRGVIWVVGMAAAIFLTVTVGLQAQMPPNRGTLTVEEFVENCNDLNRYFDLLPGQTLDLDGQWTRGSTAEFAVTYGSSDLSEYYRGGNFQILTEGDRVTGVELEIETNRLFYDAGYEKKLLAATALLGASREVNCFTLDELRTLDLLTQAEDFTWTEAG